MFGVHADQLGRDGLELAIFGPPAGKAYEHKQKRSGAHQKRRVKFGSRDTRIRQGSKKKAIRKVPKVSDEHILRELRLREITVVTVLALAIMWSVVLAIFLLRRRS